MSQLSDHVSIVAKNNPATMVMNIQET